MRVYDRTPFFLLLLGRVGTLVAIPGYNDSDLNLDCTNDYEEQMSCQLNGQNCSEYNLTLKNNDCDNKMQRCLPDTCSLHECGTGLCCCSVKMMPVMGETHTATVSKGMESLESKNIGITESIKPRTPTLMAVNKSNGNFEVFWKTNTQKLDRLSAEVTYYRKGGTDKVTEFLYTPPEVNGYKYYGINGQNVTPNTIYVVSVRSHTDWSNKFSDRSNELEFTTGPADSTESTFMALIISLSFAAAILTGAIYACSVILKTKIWDPAAKFPNPKFLDIPVPSSKPELWRPEQTIISPICVEPLIPHDGKPWSKTSLTDSSCESSQPSSGISMSSSCLSYANAEPVNVGATVQDALCKAFPNISPVSLLTTSPLAEVNRDSDLLLTPYNPCSSGSSGIDNKTYSILIGQKETMADSSEVLMQPDMACDPSYHSSERDTMNCPDQQVPLPLVSPSMASPVLADMSYQQCNADSGRFSESSLSSISSGTNTATSCDAAAEAGCESSDEVVSDATKLSSNSGKAFTDVGNPSHGCVAAQRLLAVDDDYQAFQNLVEQPAVSLTEQKSDDTHFENYHEESSSKITQFILSPVVPGFLSDAQSLSEPQTPFFLLSKGAAEQSMPLITDSGYHSV
ncbi:uncharacterized protein LOC114433859 isoform X4 [Parambassis ranga]|uniref:Uncharacterized protein LOC114433859 isoform X3 n=1 Tax=Parambassis ranga TaxID=210632 RepID=A0A6P7HRT7_9TELE|nr:uncharacterized protein LOC114433859 isoform X3 [Parambassis ranga]XP_028258415.1 uncharacterized protein LOC114433859 isoform X4 [Parambassis ranga]